MRYGKYTRKDGVLVIAICMVDDLYYFGCLTEDERKQILSILYRKREEEWNRCNNPEVCEDD